ncbi:hypothetical protein [Sulfitobacter sp. R18_1]|uniref:hypothetical protein n=1 Tax=Sulfitobacter sp. R18_1 TaxID=2821104 RepID=UPI001ADCBE26|nr:hypothetical protein [Sulfitobacter sp. R18_1]MBO9428039.1 hypothetical protein [Sulfitobacter sp. R18_1]
MRSEIISKTEFKRAQSRALAVAEEFEVREFGYQLAILEVPRDIGQKACDTFEETYKVSLRDYPFHDSDGLYEIVSNMHAEFLKNASEEERRLCFAMKAIVVTETMHDDKKWEDSFGAQLAEEFGVSQDLGREIMHETQPDGGQPWVNLVAKNAAEKVGEALDKAPAP